MKKRGSVWVIALVALLAVGGVASASATTFTSPNFSINGAVGDSVAGGQSSTNYQMTSAGGASIAGSSASKSYKLGQGFTAQLESALDLRVQPNGLIGSYSFDQGSGGSVVDDSANANNADFIGSPTWAAGKVGSGLSGFTGSDYASVDANATYNGMALTACTWMNLTGVTTNPVALSRSIGAPTTNGMWSIGFNTGSTPRVRMYANGTNNALTGTSPLGTGTWNQVCLTYGGADLVLYVNGVEDGRMTLNDAMTSFSQPISIGCISNGSQPLNGLVDEVNIYSRVLSAEEIKAGYDAGNNGLPSGVGFADITPGQSQTVAYDAIVQTGSPGYTLAINQNNNLTQGGNTIPGVSGSIASPVSWSEGSTKGLGFTLYGTNATAIPGTWNSGNSYAALPASSTSFYTRTGFTGGAKDILNMRLRLDVTSSQVAGDYTNQMVITGTMQP